MSKLRNYKTRPFHPEGHEWVKGLAHETRGFHPIYIVILKNPISFIIKIPLVIAFVAIILVSAIKPEMTIVLKTTTQTIILLLIFLKKFMTKIHIFFIVAFKNGSHFKYKKHVPT